MDAPATRHGGASASLGTDWEGAERSGRSLRMMLSSAGRRVGLMRSFREAGAALGIDLMMFASDLKPDWSPACVEADRSFAAPPAESEGFIPAMLDICRREQIELIVPTIDTELIAYAHARDEFAAINCHVAVSDAAVVEMARDKLATAQFLTGAGLPSPATIAAEDYLAGSADLPLPLLAKPRHGSSSRGIGMVYDREEVASLDDSEPYILQQFLDGREFTVSLYFDGEGRMQCAVPHERLRVRAGEVEKGVTVRNAIIEELAWRLGAALRGARGALCFQLRMDAAGGASIFEINARFGGGYPLAHRAGARFAQWLLEERLGLPLTAHDGWQDNVMMLRFDDAVFV
ncbi:ATP-grasp domain-containing protein [Novosphingobium sp. Chol11]|uniref:ATP-grasp domain-containing protein n=1 Tax=Novosphingobium sp. Chol11 TaxID=1385763 RepID=UPI000BE2F134|nr:ATP-grasp domain-containing protein [Novosphingobium sp. Chol11]